MVEVGQEDMNRLKEEELDQTVSVGEWLLLWILTAIPIVNIVILLFLAFSEKVKPNLRRYAIATLIILGVMTVGVLVWRYF
ncbi:hypothetical protein MM221_07845 [Salipaludibacillus sp. LMS25]|jgi:hypothetical protein|uniref:hypothetical protein n=1 Tax=Salipaludibacillus sp. LMS25 TaxID=2924031 RepID=UPI0020D0A8BF|nr:hypothetical protein [Salipaludibacillus sp. LMS25]UTR16443.1 hypothetical protein MM221_07845 [Salipaludibacillus sp. LMS25]